MIEQQYRTFTVELSHKRNGALLTCFKAMGLSGKNIASVTTFLIKQVRRSYAWQGNDAPFAYHLRTNRTTLQVEVVDFLNDQIAIYNKAQTAKRDVKIATQQRLLPTLSEEKRAETKIITPFVPLSQFTNVISQDVFYQILDGKFLYAMVQKWDALQAVQNNVAVPDILALPGAMAQNVVFGVRDDFNHYFKALHAYHANPAAFTGLPQEPGYLPKNGRKELTVDMAQIHKNLPRSRKPSFFLDYARTSPLPTVALAAYKETLVKN